MNKARAITLSRQVVEACAFSLFAVSFFLLAVVFLITLFLVGHFSTHLPK